MLLTVKAKSKRSAKMFLSILMVFVLAIVSSPVSKAGDSNYLCNIESLWRHESLWALDTTNTQMGYGFSMHFVSDVKVGTTHYFYYIKYTGGKPAIGLATTTNGVDFTDHGVVLAPGSTYDKNFASFPGIFYENGTFYLYYEGSGTQYGSAVYLATSTNGTNFTKHSSTPLIRGTNAWDNVGVGTPNMVKKDGVYYLFYHGFGGTDMATGVATGSSPYGPFTKYGSSPVVPCGPTGAFDCGTVGKRDIVYHNGLYYMVYEGATDGVWDDFGNAKWSTGLARSADLLTWYKYDQNPILPINQGFGNDGPDFVDIGGTLWIYYRVGVATSRTKLVNEVNGGINMIWEAENLYHQLGRADGGDGWSANVAQDNSGYLTYGPYATNVPAGNKTATFKMAIDNNTADNIEVVRIDVFDATSGVVLAWKDVKRKDFVYTYHYEFFTLSFVNPTAGHSIELRTFWYDKAYIKQDRAGMAWVN